MLQHVSRRTRPDLEAALRAALRKHGWGGTTMERIAAEAGLSRVTLHRQGVTKDVLFAQLVESATARFREAMWPALTSPAPADARLRQALETLCERAEDELELLVALRAQTDSVFHEAGDEEQLTRPVFVEPLERILRDGASEGTIRAGDAAEQATVLFNVVGWSYVHLRTGHGWKPERARRATVDLVLRGLLA